MKRNIIKSILIVVAIILAIGSILYYKNTVIDPPKQFVFENPHNKALCKEIKLLTSDSLETQYADILYLINRDGIEKLVGKDTLDLRIEDALIKYIPLFISKCNSSFAASVWNTPEWSHNFMKNRIYQLKHFEKSTGNLVVEPNSNYIKQLDDVLKVIDNYDNAWQLAYSTNYKNLETTKNRVRQAGVYLNDDRLKNCVALVQKLNELPSAIQASHLAYLKRSSKLYCGGIKGYNTYLSALKNILNNTIPEYVSYYGNSNEINEIKRDLIDEQYTLLNSFVTYVLNKYNFNDYNAYSEFNTKVYNYISTYLGNSAKREELKKRLIDGSLGQDEFYN